MTKTNGHARQPGELMTLPEIDDYIARAKERGPFDPRPILTLADGTTVRADEMWEPLPTAPGSYAQVIANVGGVPYRSASHAADYVEPVGHGSEPYVDDEARARTHRRVYPPPIDTRTAIIREERARLHETLRAETRRVMLAEQIAALRPGDEIEVTHGGRRTWARVIGGWEVARGRFVRGRTTLGMIVTTHEAHISEVRVERDEGVRQHWVGRHG